MASLGRLQVGSGTRFKSSGLPEPAFSPNVSNALLAKPPQPSAYSGLQVGSRFDRSIEPSQSLGIDGSNSLARSLSPFLIQVEPPLVLGELPSPSKKNLGRVFEQGGKAAPSAYATARNRLQQNVPGGEHASSAGSVTEFIAQGFRKGSSGGDSSESLSLSPSRNGRLGIPAIADLGVAVDMALQLRALVNTPPLVLLINPSSMTLTYTKIQQFTDKTRYGYVFQTWGEEQPKLSFNGRCGAFIAGGKGVSFASRLDSAAWQNFQTLHQFYLNNGYIYDTVGGSDANHMVGSLSIHYDGWIYYGSMESFTYTLNVENQNGGVEFNIDFTVSAMVDTTGQTSVVSPMRSPLPSKSDPRYTGMVAYPFPEVGIQSTNGDIEGVDLYQSVNPSSFGDSVGPGGTGLAKAASRSSNGFVRV